jgi:hypothetical protein
MATYERCSGEHVAERVRPAAGSEDEKRLERLVSEGAGWRRVEPAAPAAEEPTAPPAQSAAKAEWVRWAVVCGASTEEAEAMTKADLIEKYGQKGED